MRASEITFTLRAGEVVRPLATCARSQGRKEPSTVQDDLANLGTALQSGTVSDIGKAIAEVGTGIADVARIC